MAWQINYTKAAEKSLGAIDRTAAKHIRNSLHDKIATDMDPRRFGKALQGRLAGYWRYRIGDYRIICEIQDRNVIVLVIELGHRSTIYGGH